MQNRRGLIFVGLALVMGIAAAWSAGRFVPTATPAGSVQTASVVVVRGGVPVASTLTMEQLKTTEWPADLVPPGALTSTSMAVGRVVRRPLAAGEPVLASALFDSGAAGGLLAVIADKHRAVTVKVDNVIGVAGFVMPGTRVDVMATIRRVDFSKALPYSKVILQNVRVLAVDQKLEQVKSGEPEQVSVVTLEVLPVDAERLVYAAHEGRLQLAMRSPGDDEDVVTTSVGVAAVFGDKVVRRARPRAGSAVQVINGAKLETLKF